MLYITVFLYALMVPITKRTPGEKRSARVRNQFALFNKRGARTARNARRDDPRVRAARTVRSSATRTRTRFINAMLCQGL